MPCARTRRQRSLDSSPWSRRGSLPLRRENARAHHAIQRRELALQIRLALGLYPGLVRTTPARRALAEIGIQPVDDIHAAGDAAERRKAGRIEPRVVDEVDEELDRARARAARRECYGAALIARARCVVRDARAAPRGRDRGVAAYAELHDEAGHDTEEPDAVVIAVAHEVVE